MQLLRKCVMTLLFAMPVLAPAAEIRGHLEAGRRDLSGLRTFKRLSGKTDGR